MECVEWKKRKLRTWSLDEGYVLHDGDTDNKLGNTLASFAKEGEANPRRFPKQPHHGAKWWVWQGGIRVPMIVKGPGIKAGSEFNGNFVNYDFLPTFADWAGGDSSMLVNIDGVSASYMAGEPHQRLKTDVASKAAAAH